jgi:hypothetical protein
VPTIQANLQGFAKIAQNTANASQEVRIGLVGGEETLKTRGKLFSRLVEIIRPDVARQAHRQAAEAFIHAVSSSLGSSRAAGVIKGAELVSLDRQGELVASLRNSLSRQLQEGARLTGADIAQALKHVQDEVVVSGHLAKIDQALSLIDRAVNNFQYLKPAIQDKDLTTELDSHHKQLLSSVHEHIDHAQKLHRNIKANQQGVEQHARSFIFNSTPEVKTAWQEKMQALNAAARSLNHAIGRIQDVSGQRLGMAFQVEQAVEREDFSHNNDDRLRNAVPEPMREPFQGPVSLPDAPARGVLKPSPSPILVDRDAPRVDDGIEAEVAQTTSRDRAEDAALQAQRVNARQNGHSRYAEMPDNKTEYAIGFAPRDSVAQYPNEASAAAEFDARQAHIRDRTASEAVPSAVDSSIQARPRNASA